MSDNAMRTRTGTVMGTEGHVEAVRARFTMLAAGGGDTPHAPPSASASHRSSVTTSRHAPSGSPPAQPSPGHTVASGPAHVTHASAGVLLPEDADYAAVASFPDMGVR